MAITRKRTTVTGGKLRFSTPTPDGKYEVIGRLECGRQVTVLFRNAGLSQDPSAVTFGHLGVLRIHPRQPSLVMLGLHSLKMPADWPAPEDFWDLCATLLQGRKGRGYDYEFEADLKVEGYDKPIELRFTDAEFPESFFKAVNFEHDPITLVQRPTIWSPVRSIPFESASDFEDKLTLCEPFLGQPLTDGD